MSFLFKTMIHIKTCPRLEKLKVKAQIFFPTEPFSHRGSYSTRDYELDNVLFHTIPLKYLKNI